MKKTNFCIVVIILFARISHSTTDSLSNIKLIGLSNDFIMIAYENMGYSLAGEFKRIIIRSLDDLTTKQVFIIKDDKKDIEMQEKSYFDDKTKKQYEIIMNNRYSEARNAIYDVNISSKNINYLIKLEPDDNNRYKFKNIGYFFAKEDKKGDVFKLKYHNKETNTDDIVLEYSHNYFKKFIKSGDIESIINSIKEFYYYDDPSIKNTLYLYVIFEYQFNIFGSHKGNRLEIKKYKIMK